MAQVQGEEIYLAHSGQEVDDNIDEVQAARGSEASLSAKIATKQDTLTFDSTPTADSNNPVTSSGIKTAINEKASIYDIFGLGRTIAQAGDLNQLTLGRFTCANGTAAAAVTESPWTDSGYFGYTIESVRAGDRLIQIAIRNDDDFKLAKRRYTGSWQPWAYITGSVPASLNASLQTMGRPDITLYEPEEPEER